MKNLILIGMIVLTTAAQAKSLKPKKSLQAALTSFSFQQNTYLSNADVIGGDVTINFVDKKISLVLASTFRCPPNAFCAPVMPTLLDYQVELEKRHVSSCGEIIYKGDNQAVTGMGGTYVEIEVVDNTRNICNRNAIIPATEVRLTVDRPVLNSVREVHVMSGEKLKPIRPMHAVVE